MSCHFIHCKTYFQIVEFSITIVLTRFYLARPKSWRDTPWCCTETSFPPFFLVAKLPRPLQRTGRNRKVKVNLLTTTTRVPFWSEKTSCPLRKNIWWRKGILNASPHIKIKSNCAHSVQEYFCIWGKYPTLMQQATSSSYIKGFEGNTHLLMWTFTRLEMYVHKTFLKSDRFPLRPLLNPKRTET